MKNKKSIEYKCPLCESEMRLDGFSDENLICLNDGDCEFECRVDELENLNAKIDEFKGITDEIIRRWDGDIAQRDKAVRERDELNVAIAREKSLRETAFKRGMDKAEYHLSAEINKLKNQRDKAMELLDDIDRIKDTPKDCVYCLFQNPNQRDFNPETNASCAAKYGADKECFIKKIHRLRAEIENGDKK